MAIIKNRFHFGPAGDIQPLLRQVRGADTEATAARFGTISRSITGIPTAVNYGFKRSWNLSWYQMTESESRPLYRLEAAYRGVLSRATYLLDTRNTNYLAPDIASVGGDAGADHFSVVGGTLERVNTGIFHEDLAGLLDGHLYMQSSGTPGSFAAEKLTPLVNGSNYLFSAYVSGVATASLGFDLYDADEAFLTRITGPVETLSGAPQRLQFTLTPAVLPPDATTFAPCIVGQDAATEVQTSGWQLQIDESEVKPWFPGAGGAEVVVQDFTVTYPHADKRVITAVLLEV